jgi:hypothetical protein
MSCANELARFVERRGGGKEKKRRRRNERMCSVMWPSVIYSPALFSSFPI